MGGSATVSNQFRAKWGTDTRFNRIDGYIGSRVAAIDARFWETLRFVEPSPDNGGTFSYEFSSILRDSGSVFDSTMRELLKLAKYPSPRQDYDIRDYRKFLMQNVNREAFQSSTTGGIETIVLVMNSPWARRHLMPYKGWENNGTALEWWNAYNDVKHSDLEKIARGNLVNSVNALGAVAILNTLIGTTGGWTRTFGRPMFFDPMDEILAGLF
jgi:hypothetical protein